MGKRCPHFSVIFLALKWRKFYTFELEYLWGQLADLDQILRVASLRAGKCCIMFWGRLDQNNGKMLSHSFLIESSSNMLVTRTGVKARSSSILGQIRLLILELFSIESRKCYTFELEYLWSQLANLHQILCVASMGLGKGCIMFWGRLDQNSSFLRNRKPHWLDVSTFSRLFYIRSFFILAGNEDMHKLSDEFEFRPDRTTDCGVSCPWASKKIPIDL